MNNFLSLKAPYYPDMHTMHIAYLALVDASWSLAKSILSNERVIDLIDHLCSHRQRVFYLLKDAFNCIDVVGRHERTR